MPKVLPRPMDKDMFFFGTYLVFFLLHIIQTFRYVYLVCTGDVETCVCAYNALRKSGYLDENVGKFLFLFS